MTEQEKREKVIKGLEFCITVRKEDACKKCPYSLDEWSCDLLGMKRDALTLLKAQEPRVMTADDLLQLKYGSIAILEQKITGVIISAVVVDNITLDGTLEVLQVVTPSVNGVANADYDYYGKTWRCWTSRPTDEQRNNTPWEV